MNSVFSYCGAIPDAPYDGWLALVHPFSKLFPNNLVVAHFAWNACGGPVVCTIAYPSEIIITIAINLGKQLRNMSWIIYIDNFLLDFHVGRRLSKILYPIMHRDFHERWANFQIIISDHTLPRGSVERNPRSFLLSNFYQRVVGSIGRFLVGAINLYCVGSINDEDDKAKYFRPKFNFVAPIFLCLAGYLIAGWRWWHELCCGLARIRGFFAYVVGILFMSRFF